MSSPISLEVLYRWDAPADVDGALEINSSMDNIKDTDIVSEMASNGGPLLSESYSKVPVDDDRLVGRNVHDIRSLDHDVLMHELEIILCDIVSRVGGDLCPPVDIFKPLVLLGMDSMSVIQFKGVLDNR